MSTTAYPPLGQLARHHAMLARIPESKSFPSADEEPVIYDLDDLADYANDIYLSMLVSEGSQLYPYKDDMHYFRYRRILVDWMGEVGEEFHLNPLTVYSAVHYLDRILARVQVGRSRLQLVAMACILIAAKFEEQEDYIPNLVELNETSNNAYTTQLISSMESTILAELKWHLKACTPLHFLGYYMVNSVTVKDSWRDRACNNRVKFYVDRYAEFFLELCMQEHTFLQCKPSMIAASALLTARSMLQVTPTWSEELISVSGYTEAMLEPVVSSIKSWYDTVFPQMNKDNGEPISPQTVMDPVHDYASEATIIDTSMQSTHHPSVDEVRVAWTEN